MTRPATPPRVLPSEAQVEGHEHALDSDEDVPVNKIASFNGKLNQYIHTSGPSSGPSSGSTERESQSISPSKPTLVASGLKRELPASDIDVGLMKEQTTQDIISSPKRSKKMDPTTPHPLPPPRVTRSRTSRTIISMSQASTSVSSPKKPPRRHRNPPPTCPLPPIPSLLRDTIPPNLILLLVGVNPGILTGSTGYAYAHPSNLFWKLLHSSGITSTRHPPSDTYKLPALYSVGNTNIVARPTRDASMLSKAEMDAGVPELEAKVAAQRPEAVCLVGKSIWEAVWRVRHGRGIRKEEFRYGWQVETENMGCVAHEDWGGAPVFVATTTSGLAAGMRPAEKEAVWAELGAWVVKRRAERGEGSGGSNC
ncbi:hypothetical protein N7462_008095 [Penicillium macrosclerotiorum]|uniref:uncharacterized protein n=1 Tax=Penicillium macrosclerotiorum TaxID=303699 RepID=UPI002547B317|nr:uncharacterized protein N7462_008095 [Penicillium macrosclerotiorum]KAJ5679851.1 hypothetical protein N7462_008095 [Penicillium macrosclerotiorum]